MMANECHVCMKKHCSCARALVYLDYSLMPRRRCTMSEEAVEELNEQLRVENEELKKEGWQSTRALLPVLKLHGTRLPPAWSIRAYEMKQTWNSRRQTGSCFLNICGYNPASSSRQMEQQKVDRPFVMNTFGGPVNGRMVCAAEAGLSFMHAQVQLR